MSIQTIPLSDLDSQQVGSTAELQGNTPLRRCPRTARRAACKRAFDIAVAGGVFMLLVPVWIVVLLLLACRRVVLRRSRRVGMKGRIFHEFSIVTRADRSLLLGTGRFAVLINVLEGDMSIVGPRAVCPEDPLLDEPDAAVRFEVRPGLICLHWIRRQTNIDYSREIEADRQYVATQSLRGDLGIVLRALPALFLGGTRGATADVATILDIRIDNLTLDHAVEQVVAQLAANEPSQVCFVNADCVNIARHDLQYLEILRRADLTLADGIGLKLAGKILGSPIRQNVNGTDMFPRLCAALARSGRGMFLLGGRPGVPEAVRDWLAANYPQVNVRGCHHGYFSPQQEPAVLRQIAESGAELLLVALGAPRQEKWIDRHQRDTGARVAMGVGGLFDFYSGRIPRCPQWLREMGLEWLYRFWQEPGRLWRRYFVGNGVFLLRVCWARLHLPTTLHRTA